LEALAIREESWSEQVFSWNVSSAIGEVRTSVTFYLSQNKQLRSLMHHDNKRALSTVSLSSRRLEEVPRHVFESTALYLGKLDLSCNCLTSLSESVQQLVNVTYLDLSCNQLSVLPPGLLHLSKLLHLDVSHNELVEVSDSIGFLRRLTYLNVSSNRLRDLPLSLACLPALRDAILQDSLNPTNKFRFPSEVLEGGSLSIITHLKYALKRMHRYMVAGVFFIGNSNGKAKILQMLAGATNEIMKTSSGGLSSYHINNNNYIGRVRKLSSTEFTGSAGLLGKFYSRSGTSMSSYSSDTNSSESDSVGDDGCSVETSLFRLQMSRSRVMESPRASKDFESNNNNTSNNNNNNNSNDSINLNKSGNNNNININININKSGNNNNDNSNNDYNDNSNNSNSNNASNFGSSSSNEGLPVDLQVEAWDFSGLELVSLLQRRNTTFVCVVNVSSERFSSASTSRLIQQITKFSGTRVLIVGTYLEAVLGPSQQAFVTLELDRVATAFPGLVVGKLLVSLKTDSKIARKSLREMVSRMAFETWSQQPEVPSSYIVFGRMLHSLASIRSVPVLTWEEMTSVASSCGINEEKRFIEACSFVEGTGHVAFSDGIGSDWAILSPSWMVTMWSPMRMLHNNSETRGVISADDVFQAWKATGCPDWGVRAWVAMLKRLKVLWPISSRRLFVVSHLLSTERPSDLESRFWPAHCLQEHMQYSRVYTMAEPFHDEALISQLAARLATSHWQFKCLWREGLVMTLGEEELLVECHTTTVKMSVRAHGVSVQLITLIFLLNGLLSEYCASPPVVEVPCIHCMQLRSYDPYMFSKAELEDAVASGKGVVLCRSVNPILIHSMAPDISMTSISAHMIEEESLGSLQLIGEGGFAKVCTYYFFVKKREIIIVKIRFITAFGTVNMLL
jgi:Leucine-rich repeat (LRR) protein